MSRRNRQILFAAVGAAALTVALRTAVGASADYGSTVAQAAADAAALAGAASFLEVHDDAERATRHAIRLAELDGTDDVRVSLRHEDVEIDLREGIIRVRVEAQPLALPAPLSWLPFLRGPTVAATAAAEAQDVRCVEAGVSPEGYPLERCEGQVKYLRLIS